LTDDNHRLLALWAADSAEHVLQHFELERPNDDRPRVAIGLALAWGRGQITMSLARKLASATKAALEVSGAARFAALSAAQAVVVSHVAAHDLGAAAYAIKAARSVVAPANQEEAGRRESSGAIAF